MLYDISPRLRAVYGAAPARLTTAAASGCLHARGLLVDPASARHTWLVISRAAVVAYMPLLRRLLPFPKGPCFPHIPRNTRLTRFMFSLTAGVTRDLKLGGREWRSGRAPFWGLHTYPCPSHYACAWTPTKLRLRLGHCGRQGLRVRAGPSR